MPPKNWFIKTGDFLFKWRNIVFPPVLLFIFIAFLPPAEYFGQYWLEDGLDILAVLLIISGLVFRSATIGWAYIKRGGMHKKVYADTLVTSGYFNLCRNPLYVGNMIIYAGIFIFHGHLVAMVVGISLYYFIYESMIAAEEYFLKQKFGNEYLEYCERVPRLIPDFSRYRQATKDMSFSFRRSIAKDYTTIFNAFLAIAVIEAIEYYVFYPWPVFINTAQIWSAFMAVLLVAVGVIRFLKKSGRLREQ